MKRLPYSWTGFCKGYSKAEIVFSQHLPPWSAKYFTFIIVISSNWVIHLLTRQPRSMLLTCSSVPQLSRAEKYHWMRCWTHVRLRTARVYPPKAAGVRDLLMTRAGQQGFPDTRVTNATTEKFMNPWRQVSVRYDSRLGIKQTNLVCLHHALAR